MAIAFVTRAATNGNGETSQTSVATTAFNAVAGNLIVALVQTQISNVSSVTDTAGNTYAEAGTVVTSGSNRGRLYYAYNCAAHATNVVTAGFFLASTYRAIVALQFSGVETASDPLDDQDVGTGSSTSPATPSLTVTAAEDVICAFVFAGADTVTGGSGYTLTNFSAGGADTTKYFADEYKIVTASEAATAACANGSWYIKAAAFKAPAASGQPTMRRWGGVRHLHGRSRFVNIFREGLAS